jgi:hypothetical protein
VREPGRLIQHILLGTLLVLVVIGYRDLKRELDEIRLQLASQPPTRTGGKVPDGNPPSGVAFLAPVASIRGDAGRAQNRRVELVAC